MISMLARMGANVVGQWAHNSNPLHVAAYRGDFAGVQIAYQQNQGYINEINADTRTPLDDAYAQQERYPDYLPYTQIIGWLTAAGALTKDEIEAASWESNPLHQAAYWGNLQRLRLLLPVQQNNVNVRNRWQRTPLDDAFDPHPTASRDHYEHIIDLLRQHGAKTGHELENAPVPIEPTVLAPENISFQLPNEEHSDRGVFGIVFRGMWNNQIPVAIKQLSDRRNVDEILRNESRLLSSLNHPNIVRFYGVLTPRRIVMEYMSGGTLTTFLHNQNYPITWDLQKIMASDIANGLAYLHEQNPPIIHRDLKPDNIMLDGNNRLKLVDFGISVARNVTYTIAGALGYMAPEVFSRGYGTAVDIFSFGVVLAEMVTLETPLLHGTYAFQLSENNRVILYTRGDARRSPAVIRAIMRESLQNAPSRRPTARDIVTRLQQAGTAPPPPNDAPRLTL